MQFTFNASGSPTEVRESINQQAKAATRGAASHWPVVAAVRDQIGGELAGVPADQMVTVQVSIAVTITGAERKVPAGHVTSAATGTVPVEGKAVAVVGKDRVVPTDLGMIPGDPLVGGPDVPLPPLTGSEPSVAGVSDTGVAASGRRASDRTSK